MDRYSYHEYTILLGATSALAHIGVHFTHHIFGHVNFMSKHPEEAMDFLSYVAKTSKAWDEPNH